MNRRDIDRSLGAAKPFVRRFRNSLSAERNKRNKFAALTSDAWHPFNFICWLNGNALMLRGANVEKLIWRNSLILIGAHGEFPAMANGLFEAVM